MRGVAVTLDTDWAPDAAIDHAARLLIDRGVPATWFVTHASPAVDRLRERPDLFELGIHPNFLAGSTHGSTPEEVLAHCLSLVPDAVSMRTHSLHQSTPLLALVLETTEIRVDSSLLLTGATGVTPSRFVWESKTLVRVPMVWEDDLAMEEEPLELPALDAPGLTVLDFHPIHVFLNSRHMAPYRELRSRHRLQEADVDALVPYVQDGAGVGALFVELLDAVAARGRAFRIGEFHPARSARLAGAGR